MKPGSHVVCIDNSKYTDMVHLDTPYTVREILPVGSLIKSNGQSIFKTAEVGITLEEIKSNPIVSGITWFDMPFPIVDFRELQLPGELAEALSDQLELV